MQKNKSQARISLRFMVKLSMIKHSILQKNYTLNQSGYQLKLPLELETIIPENDSVRLLSQFVEEMDLTDLYSTYERINSLSMVLR